MVKKLNEIYRCSVCGNMVAVVRVGGGTLVCCGKEMEQLAAGTVDAAAEKHVPVITKTASGIKIKIGAVAHPMEASHYIEWIEAIVDGRSYRHWLKPGELPEAEFTISGQTIIAREYCNLHGLWQSE